MLCRVCEQGGIPPALLERPFDLICFRESIYYMRDLRETFDLLQTMLVRGGWLYIKVHVVTSLFYRQNRDVLSRYRPVVSGLPTEDFLRSALDREGYRVRAVAYPAFDLVSMLGWNVGVPVLRGGLLRLNDLVLPWLCRANRRVRSVADCVAVVAQRA